MMLFGTRSFWLEMRIPRDEYTRKIEHYFGSADRKIENRREAIELLKNVTTTIQEKMVNRIKDENTCAFLLKMYFIFDEVHHMYLKEKEARSQLSKYNFETQDIIETFLTNAHIQRDIIDSCNIWIENGVLLNHDIDWKNMDVEKEFVLDSNLLIDIFVYGLASRYLSLLSLSKTIEEANTFYGIEICPRKDIPVDVLKYHPYIYFNTALTGNQSVLDDNKFTSEADETDFGVGFNETYGVPFLPFLAVLKSIQDDPCMLRGDERGLRVVSKSSFIQFVESCTKMEIDGKQFYDSFVLDKEKIKTQLRSNEPIIWIVGANKYRHEIRPFIDLGDENVLLTFGAIEQSKQLWLSYFNNGGNYYTNPDSRDPLRNAMDKRSAELSKVLIEKIREILHKHFSADIDLVDVDYDRIFGEKEENYGDYDVVYFDKGKKELFLIESKYFSDSLNATGLINDYTKMFGTNGYYSHCRKRYDLVLEESEKLKAFIDVTGKIRVHMLFVSSKPIEMELQDEDNVVTFLSLNIFEKYITGKLLYGEDGNVIDTSIEI